MTHKENSDRKGIPILYFGIFLDSSTREILLRQFSPIHKVVYGDHVTLAFKPDATTIEVFTRYIGLEIPLTVVEEISDLYGQAVRVEVNMLLPIIPEDAHITISTATNIAPKYSKELFARAVPSAPHLRKAQHSLRLVGTLDSFPPNYMRLDGKTI